MVPMASSGTTINYNLVPDADRVKYRFPPPAKFKLGDFVTIMQGRKEVPGVIVEVDPTRIAPYRVGGYYKDVDYVWFEWCFRQDLAHDLN